jgi:hypothetical protein
MSHQWVRVQAMTHARVLANQLTAHGFSQATFTSLATSGKRVSKCGICHGTMTYITTRPSRLYCETCEAVCAVDSRHLTAVLLRRAPAMCMHRARRWVVQRGLNAVAGRAAGVPSPTGRNHQTLQRAGVPPRWLRVGAVYGGRARRPSLPAMSLLLLASPV